MTHVLGMTVVAEGVETAKIVRSKRSAVSLCQGFYFARPMPADDLDALLRLGTVDIDLRLPLSDG